MAQVESDSNYVDSSLSNFLYDEDGGKIPSSEIESLPAETAITDGMSTEEENSNFETPSPEESVHEETALNQGDAITKLVQETEAIQPRKPGAKIPPARPRPTKVTSALIKRPTTRVNRTTRVKAIRILPIRDNVTKIRRTPKTTINVPTMIVTDRRGVPRRITLTTPSTRGSTFTFPPWFYNSSYTFPEYSAEEDIPAIYRGRSTTLLPDISESMDEYSYFTTMNPEKRKRSEMKWLFTWPISSKFSPFYEWYYNSLKDIKGRNRRMEGAEHLLIEVNYSEEKPSTPFIVPEKLLNYFLYVNKMNSVLKLNKYWSTFTVDPNVFVCLTYYLTCLKPSSQNPFGQAGLKLSPINKAVHAFNLRKFMPNRNQLVEKYVKLTNIQPYYLEIKNADGDEDDAYHYSSESESKDYMFETTKKVTFTEFTLPYNESWEFFIRTSELNNSYEVDTRAQKLFNFTWEPTYREFYKWFYRIVMDRHAKPERLEAFATFSTPEFEQYFEQTPWPVPLHKLKYYIIISKLFETMEKQKMSTTAGTTPLF